VYVAIYNLPFTLQRKTMLLSTLMGGHDWSWRVVGITPGALDVLEANNYRYVKGKVCRAHLVGRHSTAGVVFTRPQPFGEDEFFRTFWENDETVITTKSENKASASPPEHLRIDHNLGLFVSNPLVGWRHTSPATSVIS
jgi:hypothetical protein